MPGGYGFGGGGASPGGYGIGGGSRSPSEPWQLLSVVDVEHSPSPSHSSPLRATSHVGSSKSVRQGRGHSSASTRWRQTPQSRPASHRSHGKAGGEGGGAGYRHATRRYTSAAVVVEEDEVSRRPGPQSKSRPAQLLISVVPHSPSASHSSPTSTRSHVCSLQSLFQAAGQSPDAIGWRQMPHEAPAAQ